MASDVGLNFFSGGNRHTKIAVADMWYKALDSRNNHYWENFEFRFDEEMSAQEKKQAIVAYLDVKVAQAFWRASCVCQTVTCRQVRQHERQ